jgi:hypothetical protein
MNSVHEKFINLSKKYEALKDEIKAVKVELVETMAALGVGDHFQDPSDGTVFQIVKPSGTFISYEPIGYERTKRAGEVKGTMSIKAANELGYTV